jgi:PAS domain S-box-containing protein
MRRTKDDKALHRDPVNHTLEELCALSDGIDEIIYVLDPKTYEILFANEKTEELFGKGVVGKKCYNVFQKLNKPCPNCTNKYVFGKNLGKTYVWDHQNLWNKRWYKGIYKAIKWLGGKYVKYGISIDISKQKKMEEALRESEEFFRSAVENSHSGILILDDKFTIIYANDEAVRMGGCSKKEIVGQDFRKFLDENSKTLVQDRYLRRQRGEEPPPQYEFKIVTKKGEVRDVECKSSVMRYRCGKTCTMAQLIDITERKRMEEERKHFEERLSALNMYGQSLNMAKNPEEIYKLILDAMEQTLGFEFADVFMVEGKMLRLVAHRGNSKDLTVEFPIDGKKGITVQAVKTAKSIFVSNVSENKAYVKGAEGIRSELAVPIKVGNKVIGVLNVESKKPTTFNHEHRKLLEILASHAAISMTNLKRQTILSALNEYGQNLNRAQSLEEIYGLTQDAMKKILGFTYASILIVEGRKLRLITHRGYPSKLGLTLSLDGKKGITVRAVRTGKPVIVPDIRKAKAYVKGGEDILSELVVPIKVGSKILGVLNVESKKLAAFDDNEKELLEILASHAAIAMTKLRRQIQLKDISKRLEYLMKNTTKIMNVKDMHQRLTVIAKAIQKFGWRRVVISLRDENLEGTDLVTAGLTEEENKLLRARKAPGHVWKERLGPTFERFKISEFYYLPWTDQWIREKVHGVPRGASPEEATTYAGVPSRLSSEEMVDWHPQDMLYAPLRTPEGRIVGILSMDDPVDGCRPTKESLTPLELFLHQAAMIIENAQLIKGLREARELLEQKVEERTRELKKSQEQLLRAQRLAVIGELSGMVGHDLRNPLTSIAGAAYYMRKRMGSRMSQKIGEMIDLIEKNIAYSNKIINDLLDYSRETKLDLKVTDPKSLIKEALSLVEIPKNVQLVDLTKNKPKIAADIEKVKRAFVNIVKNAFDAMPKGGALTMECRKMDGNLVFTFSDTGMGMSKETLTKTWTPLFTTKAKGMGFGLPICKRIIEAHGGSISVKSTLRKGTTFTVILPIEPKTEEIGGEKIWVKPPEYLLLTTTKTSEKC